VCRESGTVDLGHLSPTIVLRTRSWGAWRYFCHSQVPGCVSRQSRREFEGDSLAICQSVMDVLVGRVESPRKGDARLAQTLCGRSTDVQAGRAVGTIASTCAPTSGTPYQFSRTWTRRTGLCDCFSRPPDRHKLFGTWSNCRHSLCMSILCVYVS
jgi:hypothetical protein